MGALPDQTQRSSREPGVIAQWRSNQPGFFGLVLSFIQLLMHGLWLGITESAVGRRVFSDVASSPGQRWLIVGLLIISCVATLSALFFSIYGSVSAEPKTPAIVGLILSFFTGAFLTFVFLLTALAAGAQQ
ncbi:MAG: hypothetical protein MK110_14295 [Fuerstiella sp.]|nr:hypothetical protein [Fuerstiella sp.]